MRADWDSVKDDVMYKCLKVKFSHEHNPELYEKLRATGKAQIIEHTTKDRYWGDGGDGGDGSKGKNRLGELLMKIRKEMEEVATNKD